MSANIRIWGALPTGNVQSTLPNTALASIGNPCESITFTSKPCLRLRRWLHSWTASATLKLIHKSLLTTTIWTSSILILGTKDIHNTGNLDSERILNYVVYCNIMILIIFAHGLKGASWSWSSSYGSWIYNYLYAISAYHH